MKMKLAFALNVCLFVGEPHLSIGRLLIEFFANLLTGVDGAQLFQKVRNCHACGSHLMVLIFYEVGQNALTKSKKGLIEKNSENYVEGLYSSRSLIFSKRVYSPLNTRSTVPVGPLRCLTTITSALPFTS